MTHHVTRPRRRTLLLSLPAAATALALAGCSAGATDASSSASGAAADTVTIGLTAEPASLDFTTTDGAAIPQALLHNVYQGLVTLDADGEIAPELADSWTVDATGTVYTFELHDGVTFSDGSAFDADDVVFSIERVQSDWTVSLASGMDVVKSVEATSPTEVVVTLSAASNSWLYKMTTRIGAMFSTTGVDDLAHTAIGTGPYTVGTWTKGDSLELDARDDYWGEAPATPTVVLKYFDDTTAETNALISGGIDVVYALSTPDSLAQFDGDDRFEVVEGSTNGEVTLSLNNAAAPFDDLRVRQAVAHAIDRDAIIATAAAGYGTAIGSMVPPTDPWYEDLTGTYDYDPDAAKALLAEAGATDLSVSFDVPNLPYATAAAQVVVSQLAAVGITATINTLEFPAAWLETVFTDHDYQMSIVSHTEPRDIVNVVGSDYYFGYQGTDLTGLVTAADTVDADGYEAAMQALEEGVAEQLPAVYLYVQPNLTVTRTGVTGVPQDQVTEFLDVTGIAG